MPEAADGTDEEIIIAMHKVRSLPGQVTKAERRASITWLHARQLHADLGAHS